MAAWRRLGRLAARGRRAPMVIMASARKVSETLEEPVTASSSPAPLVAAAAVVSRAAEVVAATRDAVSDAGAIAAEPAAVRPIAEPFGAALPPLGALSTGALSTGG